MVKPNKQNISRIITIIKLLDGKRKQKNEIILEIYNSTGLDKHIVELVFNDPINKPFKDVEDPDDYIGKALRYLEREDITDRRVSKKPDNKPGRRNDYWWLISNAETLFKIVNLIKQCNFNDYLETTILDKIFKSEYCQNLINIDLINKLNDFSQIEDLSYLNSSIGIFSDLDLEFILKIVKMSPTAFFNILSLIFDTENYYNYFNPPINEYIKTLVIFNFQTDLRREILNNYPISYKIEIDLPKEPIKKDEKINRVQSTDYANGVIKHEVKSSIISPPSDEEIINKLKKNRRIKESNLKE